MSAICRGDRHNHCYTSPIYRQKVAIINKKLAERYKDHPALICWHISNEYNGECFCPLCRKEFQNWLKKKYVTLDALNSAWWSVFWSRTFTSWSQIDPPSPNGDMVIHAKNLDWHRFVTDRTADFLAFETEIVKSVTPDIPATTNLMGFFNGLDYRKLAQKIDVVSWDSYPDWYGDERDIETSVNIGMNHDLMRGLKQRPFLLMESTPSCVNFKSINKLKRPGMNELSSIQAIAHGSDSVQYFQWRKSRGGFEKFHGAVVDHEGTENTRIFKEVSTLGARLKKIDEIAGTAVHSEVALLYDWENTWALRDAGGFQKDDKKIQQTLSKFYAPIFKRGINSDIIGEYDDFSKYKLLIAPMRYMVSGQLGKKLEEYVANGGTLLCTYMTAMVNETDLCYLNGFPGAGLKELFGIWNEEIDTLYPSESNKVRMSDGSVVNAVDYCELLHARGAEVLGWYDSDFYKGMPAVTKNRYKNGTAYYVGFRDDGSFTDTLVEKLLKQTGIVSDFCGEFSRGVSVRSRTDGENIYVFLQNFNYNSAFAETPYEWQNVENAQTVTGKIKLAPLEVKILKRRCCTL